MNLTNEQIEREFERQVQLCSGIGRDAMLAIVERQFNEKRKHSWRFYMSGSFCEACGIQKHHKLIGSKCPGRI